MITPLTMFAPTYQSSVPMPAIVTAMVNAKLPI
jgi:hypothetical protein